MARTPASGLLRRRRPDDAPAHIRFVGQSGAPSVHLRRSAARALLRLARAAAPAETVGLLAGRALEDGEGRYVLVEEVEVAGRGEHRGGPGLVAFTGRGGQALRDRLLARCPALEIVGWWHSHPHGPAHYSHEDRVEQSTWSASHHVGIVVSCAAREPFGVFAGPEATPLRRRDPLVDRSDGAAVPTRSQPEPWRAVRMAPGQRPPERVRSDAIRDRLSRRDGWLITAVGAIVLVSAVVTFRAADRVESQADRLAAVPRQASKRSRATTGVRLEALRCRAGGATSIPLAPPRAQADPEPAVLNPSVATARVSDGRLKVACLAPGSTLVTVSRSAAGGLALAQMPVVVYQRARRRSPPWSGPRGSRWTGQRGSPWSG